MNAMDIPTLAPPTHDTCPYLVPVCADWLYLYPRSAYCRPPGRRVRVPAPITLTSICLTPAHRACAGYRASP
jgi:hypothetical protein